MIGLNALISLANFVPWSFIFLFVHCFGIRLYDIRNRDDCQRIQKRIGKTSTIMADGGKGCGYAVGYWYILSLSMVVSNDGNTYSCYMIATEDSFKALTAEHMETTAQDPICFKDSGSTTTISIAERMGSYYNVYFRKRQLKTAFQPRPSQKGVIETIIKQYETTNHVVVMLHGPPGTGKSMIGILLAEALKATYCNSLKPWEPADSIGYLYGEIEPTKECPLIIAFDEIDGPLVKIHSGAVERHKNLPISICDKQSWNKMMDEIQRGMYPNMILIMTTNKSPEFIRELDPSYIREGRVDIISEIAAL